jgi:hypothetical protein
MTSGIADQPRLLASFRLFFQVVSITRVLSIILIFLFDWLWRLNRPGTGLGITLHFSIWEYIVMYSLIISFLANTIISLLLSFRPRWSFSAFLKHRAIPLAFYVVELLLVPFLIYFSYEKVQESFFPKTNYIAELMKYIHLGSSAVNVYEKYEALNVVLVTICSICFVLFFWKFYTGRKKEWQTDTLQ